MYPENLYGTQVIVGSINMGYAFVIDLIFDGNFNNNDSYYQ